jgi:antitoxin CptB
MDGIPGRVRWRCRRGNLELDRLLAAYLVRRYPAAPAAERAAFERLLERPDPELLALLTGRGGRLQGDEALVVHWFRGAATH